MLLAAVLLIAQTTAEPPPAADEVVVIGQRMRELSISIKTDRKNGGYYCEFKRRSFDPSFDALICEYSLGCANTIAKWSQFEGCVRPKVEAYVRALVARRKAKLKPS